jgi:hypothetical protein
MCWIYINYAYTNLIVDVRCIRKMKEKERYTHTQKKKILPQVPTYGAPISQAFFSFA